MGVECGIDLFDSSYPLTILGMQNLYLTNQWQFSLVYILIDHRKLRSICFTITWQKFEWNLL